MATDAIGMGVSLPIKRIIFCETTKFDGIERRPLTTGEVNQIAGRAGATVSSIKARSSCRFEYAYSGKAQPTDPAPSLKSSSRSRTRSSNRASSSPVFSPSGRSRRVSGHCLRGRQRASGAAQGAWPAREADDARAGLQLHPLSGRHAECGPRELLVLLLVPPTPKERRCRSP